MNNSRAEAKPDWDAARAQPRQHAVAAASVDPLIASSAAR